MSDASIIAMTDSGLHCPAGGFFVDPWGPVERAVITHAHADHARPGSGHYLCAAGGRGVLRLRMGTSASIETLAYGEPRRIGDATVSLHPAGHVLGSAQVRIDVAGRVCVISGDYATHANPTCAPFETVPCDTFITECTFGLPVYRWPSPDAVFDEINRWWQENREAGVTTVVLAYALGKAQRVLAGVDASIGPILLHGAVSRLTEAYRAEGVPLPPAEHCTADLARAHRGRALVIAPVSAAGASWLRKFGEQSIAQVSGWMRIRGARRRRTIDRGFVLSDHADWPGLVGAVDATGAERIGVTHGYTDALSRWLREQGREVDVIPTRFEAGPEEDDSAQSDAAA